jgi:4'-phosphopantetheinyl transferase
VPHAVSASMIRADLGYVFVDETVSPGDLAHAEELLSIEEQTRSRRFHFEADRRQFVVAHALARTMLSARRPDVAPAAWQFRTGRHGKPDVAAPAGSTDLRFNLSHTRGLAACIVCAGIDVGIDVEVRTGRVDGMGVAARLFAPSEIRALERLAPDARRHAFLTYWTLKEAYLKACGAGLSLRLDRFSFEIDEGAPPRIVFDPDMQEDAHRWQFEQFRPSDEHWMAVALRRGTGPDVAIACRRILPGVLGER